MEASDAPNPCAKTVLYNNRIRVIVNIIQNIHIQKQQYITRQGIEAIYLYSGCGRVA
jgi:hypothetical protein